MIDAFTTYLLAERRYSELTVRNYRRDLIDFMEYLGVGDDDFCPSLVKADDIRGWIVSLSDSGRLSAASVNREVSSVRSFFRWLRADGKITKDPFMKVGTLKTSRRLPVWIPEGKMEKITDSLLRVCDGEGDLWQRRDAIILLLFYSCGIRLAELIDIRTDDISAAYDSVRVRGKGGKERVVPLPSVTGAVLKRYVAEITSLDIWKLAENKLFLTVKGTPVSRTYVYMAVRGGLERMGIKGKRSPHVLRHTFATHLLDSGADMREIQELLGHSSLSATQIYTHNSISHLKKAYQGAHPRGRGPEKEGGALRKEDAALSKPGAALGKEGTALSKPEAALEKEGLALEKQGAGAMKEEAVGVSGRTGAGAMKEEAVGVSGRTGTGAIEEEAVGVSGEDGAALDDRGIGVLKEVCDDISEGK